MLRLLQCRRIFLICFGLIGLAVWGGAESNGAILQSPSSSTPAQLAATPAKPSRVLFLVGEREYDTKTTLAEFADRQLKPLEIQYQFVHAETNNRKDPKCHDFPGLIQALEQADLLVISVRRRFLTPEQLEALQNWIESGKPVVAIRTASHAFAAYKPADVPQGRSAWQDFDQQVLGGHYLSHYSNKTDNGEPATEIWLADNASQHAVMAGATWSGRRPADSHLYIIKDLHESATVLIYGQVPGQAKAEPVAWVYQREKGKSFYTTLGSVKDFSDPFLNRILANAIKWGLE